MHYSMSEFHGAVTHFPIAMLIAALAFDIGAPLFRKPEWRIVSFWLLVVAVVSCIPSLMSGWVIGNQFYGKVPHPPDIYVRHRFAAFATSIAATLLLAWRIGVKDKPSTGALVGLVTLTFLACVGVSYTGYLGGLMTMGSGSSDETTTSTPAPAASTAALPALDPALVVAGKALYTKNGCDGCHAIGTTGGSGGPNLTHEGLKQPDIDWQVAHMMNPQKMKPSSTMPAYSTLSPDQLKAIAEYMSSLR
ncbi:MAG: DUF2231 domain-containing protein [Capsulimonadaceae bacterium]